MLIPRISGFLLALLLMGPLPWVIPDAASSEEIGGLMYSTALIDQAAVYGSEPATLGLALQPRGGLSLEAETREESRDWDGLKQDTLYFGFTQMAVIGVLYVSPKSVSGWSSEKKDEYSFEKWRSNVRSIVWDTDKWWINYVLHPYWGGAYYVRAMERGYGPVPSFWYSFMLSTMYEFGAEALFERPSIQDLVFTPGLGFFVGQYFMSVREGLKYRAMNGEAFTGADKAKLFFTDPLGAVNRGINNTFGRQVSFALYPAVMTSEAPIHSGPDSGAATVQAQDLFSGLRMYLTW